MVASGEEGGPGRRAQGRDVEAVEPGPVGRQRIEVRRLDVGAETSEMGEPGVIEHDRQHVGRRGLGVAREAGGGLGRREADLLRCFSRSHAGRPA